MAFLALEEMGILIDKHLMPRKIISLSTFYQRLLKITNSLPKTVFSSGDTSLDNLEHIHHNATHHNDSMEGVSTSAFNTLQKDSTKYLIFESQVTEQVVSLLGELTTLNPHSIP